MRLAAKVKSGFYPLEEAVIPTIVKAIDSVDPEATIYDPCCGKGEAVVKLAAALGIKPDNVYGSEMDNGRSSEAAKIVPRMYESVDFLTAQVYSMASIIYCNPPFDDELGGGGRVEWRFIDRVGEICKPGTLLIAILPERVATNYAMFEVLNKWFCQTSCIPFPKECKATYKEHIVFGVRRETKVGVNISYYDSCYMKARVEHFDPFEVKKGGRTAIRKLFYNEAELTELLVDSKPNELLDPKGRENGREIVPPMRLSHGHVAMLLSSGMLDGAISADGVKPHMVRGSTRKTLSEKAEKTEKGAIRLTSTERIQLCIKIADETGVRELVDEVKTESELPPETEEENDGSNSK